MVIYCKNHVYFVKHSDLYMRKNHGHDYLSKHEQIREKLIELTKESRRACFDVSRLASELGMDIRTVRAHLRIMEIDMVGVFMDPSEKQFCTKEGLSLLANILKVDKKEDE
jgi:hypothetical protein